MADFEPTILGFLCNWCSYAAADLAGTSRKKYPSNVRFIRVMCSGRIDPQFILGALKNGADGVLVGGCHFGDCHYLTGNYKTYRKVELVKNLLDQLGLDSNRVRFEQISASEGERLAQVVADFTEQIKTIGPNPINQRRE